MHLHAILPRPCVHLGKLRVREGKRYPFLHVPICAALWVCEQDIQASFCSYVLGTLELPPQGMSAQRVEPKAHLTTQPTAQSGE